MCCLRHPTPLAPQAGREPRSALPSGSRLRPVCDARIGGIGEVNGESKMKVEHRETDPHSLRRGSTGAGSYRGGDERPVGAPLTRPFRRPRREPGPGRVTRSLRSLRSTSPRFSPLSSHSRPLRSSLPHSIPAGGRSEGTERYATR